MDYTKKRFEQLFKDNYQAMYRMAFSVTEDEEDARDAVSHVFTKMWHSQPQIGELSVRGYLLAAVRNQSLNIVKQRQLKRELEEELRNEKEAAESEARQELMDELRRVIDSSLTEQDRRILELHYDETLTYGETARQLGISVAAVNKHITRSLSRIRQTLKIAK